MGHNLGMDHDFDGSWTDRQFRNHNGKKCAGYLDYDHHTQGWSGCSVGDFKSFINRLATVCIGKGGKKIDILV